MHVHKCKYQTAVSKFIFTFQSTVQIFSVLIKNINISYSKITMLYNDAIIILLRWTHVILDIIFNLDVLTNHNKEQLTLASQIFLMVKTTQHITFMIRSQNKISNKSHVQNTL